MKKYELKHKKICKNNNNNDLKMVFFHGAVTYPVEILEYIYCNHYLRTCIISVLHGTTTILWIGLLMLTLSIVDPACRISARPLNFRSFCDSFIAPESIIIMKRK